MECLLFWTLIWLICVLHLALFPKSTVRKPIVPVSLSFYLLRFETLLSLLNRWMAAKPPGCALPLLIRSEQFLRWVS